MLREARKIFSAAASYETEAQWSRASHRQLYFSIYQNYHPKQTISLSTRSFTLAARVNLQAGTGRFEFSEYIRDVDASVYIGADKRIKKNARRIDHFL